MPWPVWRGVFRVTPYCTTLAQIHSFEALTTLKVWINLLLDATHREHKRRVGTRFITLESGQLQFGRVAFGKRLGINPSKVRRVMDVLKADGMIESQVDESKQFSIVTILNWEDYQQSEQGLCPSEQEGEGVTGQGPAKDRPGTGQGPATNKKGYKGEEGKHDPPAGDEQSLFDEEATADLHESEREWLGILEHMLNWPYHFTTDLTLIRGVAPARPDLPHSRYPKRS